MRDEKFAASFANSLNIPFISKAIDVPKIADELKLGLEEAARKVRYEAFGNAMLESKGKYSFVATAHNATDNLETVVFNMLRGAGSHGMKGISPIRDNIIRPLIRVSKQDILSSLDQAEIPYVIDSSNNSLDYTRNFIRHEILPLFRKISANPEASVSKLCTFIWEDNDFIYGIAEDFIAKNKIGEKVSADKLRTLHSAPLSRVIIRLISECSSVMPEAVHVNGIKTLLSRGGDFSLDIPGGFSFVCEDKFCFVRKRLTADHNPENNLVFSIGYGVNIIDELGIAVLVSKEKNEVFSSNVYNFSIQASVSSDIIIEDLIVRTRKDGDSYVYGGMTRKIKKLFRDKKIPKSEREMIPLICDDKGILWIPGYSVRDSARSCDDKAVWISVYKKSCV